MHTTFQILERHRSTLQDHQIHWFDAPSQSDLIKHSDQQFNLHWSNDNQLSLDDQQSIENLSISTGELNILFFPKSKERLDWWLAKISEQLKENQQLWIVGENNSGIKSIEKRVKAHFDAFKIDSARHCVLVELRQTATLSAEHSSWQNYSLSLPNTQEPNSASKQIFSLPGVFSAAKLDKGSAILLQQLPQLNGHVLEFGCGAGVLSLAIAEQAGVNKLVATDIDALAILSTQKTLAANDLQHKAQLHWSDGLANVEQQRFDAIVTNPPFHQGIKTAYAASEEFFAQAHNWLKPGGQLIWVANDFLSYQPYLAAEFEEVVELTRERGFKVLMATKSKKR